MDRLNEMAQKCKENSDIFTKICYAKDDPAEKFEYLTTMLNLELSSASKLTKWITADPRERIDKTREALNVYKKLNNYVEEYLKFKSIQVSEIENEQVKQ